MPNYGRKKRVKRKKRVVKRKRVIKRKKVIKAIGKKASVYKGFAKRTSGGLTKKDIVRTKSVKTLKFSDGKMKVDLFTASALVTVLNKVNADNREKLTRMVNGKKAQFTAAAKATFKMLNKAR